MYLGSDRINIESQEGLYLILRRNSIADQHTSRLFTPIHSAAAPRHRSLRKVNGVDLSSPHSYFNESMPYPSACLFPNNLMGHFTSDISTLGVSRLDPRASRGVF